MKFRCGLIAILCIALSETTHATTYRFEAFDYDSHYVSIRVDAVARGEDGYVWIATNTGLQRFDGRWIKLFKHSDEPGSVSNNHVLDVIYDASGTLWAATEDGLNRFDPQTETFQQFLHDPADPSSIPGKTVRSLAVDSAGVLWLATDGGLARFDAETETFARYVHDPSNPSTLSENLIIRIAVDAEDNVWALANGTGVNHLNADTGEVTRYLPGAAQHRVDDRRARSVGIGADGSVWIGYRDGDLAFLDRVSGNFLKYTESVGDVAPFNVSAITPLSDGKLMLGTVNRGLFVLDPAGQEDLEWVPPSSTNPDGMRASHVEDIFEDAESNIWIATIEHGLYFLRNAYRSKSALSQYSAAWNRLPDDLVWSVYEDSAGRLWVGTNTEGVVVLDRGNREARHYRHDPADPSSLSGNLVLDVFEDSDGSVWLGTGGGLSRFDPETETFERFFEDADHPLASYMVAELFEDSEGGLWATTLGGGLARFIGDEQQIFQRQEQGNSISHNYVTSVAESADGVIWIGTRDGLDRLELATGAISNFDLPDNWVLSLHYSAKSDRMLAGTGNGLVFLDPGSGERALQDITDQIPPTQVFCILEVEDSYILGTGFGIVTIAPQNIVEKFTWFHGIQAGYNLNACDQGADSTLYFGGNKGVDYFRPDELKLSDHKPVVHITGVRLQPRDGSAAESLPMIGPAPELAHDQNDLRINFTGIYFANTKGLTYRHRLLGLSDAWTVQDKGDPFVLSRLVPDSVATYMNLAAGDYTFEVQYQSVDGAVSDTARYTFAILPAWWETTLAKLVYVLAAILLLTAFVRWRTRQSERERRVLDRLVKERTVELNRMAQRAASLAQQKTRLFANVSHEFRTPLTLIINPITTMLEKTNDADARHRLDAVKRNAMRLLGMVDRMVTFSQLDAEARSPRVLYDVNAAVTQVCDGFETVANEQSIQLTIRGTDPVYVSLTEDSLEQIVTNLVSNALKYTESGGEVTVSVRFDNPDVVIEVRDTGIGISEDRQTEIFERFHRIESERTSQVPGTGLGLAVVAELVKANGGRIEVVSTPGVGSAFSVNLPGATSFIPADSDLKQTFNGRFVELERLSIIRSAESSPSPEVAPTDDSGSRILVIEDNAEMREYVVGLLSEKYACYSASNGTAGLDLAQECIPDLIVSDVMMAGMDGYEVVHALRDDVRTSHIPIILLTAKSDHQSRIAGWLENVDDYIVKPFDPEELVYRIDSLLSVRELLRKRFGAGLSKEDPEDSPIVTEMRPKDRDFLQKFEAIVAKHYADHDFRRSTAASLMAVSERQLNRKLSALVDHNFSDYVRKYRLRQSLSLLDEGLQVAQVSERVGFSNANYFSSCFRAEYGQTAKSYQMR